MIQKLILKQGMDCLKTKQTLTDAMVTEMNAYIDALSENNFLDIPYSSFDQAHAEAAGFGFNDAAKLATAAAAGVLVTTLIPLISGTVSGIQLKSDNLAATYQISANGTTWTNISGDYNLNESVTTGFYLKITVAAAAQITGANILYSVTVC